MKNLIIILSIILSLSCSHYSGKRVEQKKQIESRESQLKKKLRVLDEFSSLQIGIDTTDGYLTLIARDSTNKTSYTRVYEFMGNIDFFSLYEQNLVDEYIIIDNIENNIY